MALIGCSRTNISRATWQRYCLSCFPKAIREMVPVAATRVAIPWYKLLTLIRLHVHVVLWNSMLPDANNEKSPICETSAGYWLAEGGVESFYCFRLTSPCHEPVNTAPLLTNHLSLNRLKNFYLLKILIFVQFGLSCRSSARNLEFFFNYQLPCLWFCLKILSY